MLDTFSKGKISILYKMNLLFCTSSKVQKINHQYLLTEKNTCKVKIIVVFIILQLTYLLSAKMASKDLESITVIQCD